MPAHAAGSPISVEDASSLTPGENCPLHPKK